MSFRCQFCGDAHRLPVRLVTQIRERTYEDDHHRISFGWEIVEEKTACEVCADRISAPTAASAGPVVTFSVSERVGSQLAAIYGIHHPRFAQAAMTEGA